MQYSAIYLYPCIAYSEKETSAAFSRYPISAAMITATTATITAIHPTEIVAPVNAIKKPISNSAITAEAYPIMMASKAL